MHPQFLEYDWYLKIGIKLTGNINAMLQLREGDPCKFHVHAFTKSIFLRLALPSGHCSKLSFRNRVVLFFGNRSLDLIDANLKFSRIGVRNTVYAWKKITSAQTWLDGWAWNTYTAGLFLNSYCTILLLVAINLSCFSFKLCFYLFFFYFSFLTVNSMSIWFLHMVNRKHSISMSIFP